MLLEKTGIFSQNQSLVGSGSIVSVNDIDLKATPFRDIGIGIKQIYVVSQVVGALVGAGTVTVNLQQSANAGAGPYTFIQTIFIFPSGQAAGVASAVTADQIQPGVITQEYLSVAYVLSSPLTGGTITTFLTPDIEKWFAYPKNYTISTK